MNKEIEDLKNSNNDETNREITQLKDELKRLGRWNAKLKEDYSSTKMGVRSFEKEKADKKWKIKSKKCKEKLAESLREL